MQLFAPLLLVLFGVTFALSKAVDPTSIRSATIYAWPLSSTPSKLAEIEYSPSEHYASVLSYTPPTSPSSNPVKLVRIGLYNSSTNTWLGSTVTSAASFEPHYQGTLRLHINGEGEAWRAAFHSSLKSTSPSHDSSKQEGGKPKVELVRPSPAPQAHLNKPVVLSLDGKVPEKEAEKSFLQKYWWVFLGVAVLAMTGGGGDK